MQGGRNADGVPFGPLFAVPKDIGPTVIYYNINAFEAVNVLIISVDAEDIEAFNNGAPDRTGRTRLQIGIPNGITIGSYGYQVITAAGTQYPDLGTGHPVRRGAGTRIFNNRIAMDWNQRDALASLLTSEHSINPNSPTRFGYYNQWWFDKGWSVGGDVIRFVDDYWRFTMGDEHRMWLATDGTFHRTQAEAGAGAIEMDYSMRDAFERFVRLTIAPGNTVRSGVHGLGISPTPEAAGGVMGFFTAGHLAMMVALRAHVPFLRDEASFAWDVAPLPVAPGGGVEAGHSGSMGIGINRRTRNPNAAFLFAEFISGRVGQEAQATTGFNVPNQLYLAHSEAFLQSDQHPRNSSIFLRGAEHQGPGDWWYLPDNSWIGPMWANVLNGEVRNNRMDITTFFNTVTDRTDERLAEITRRLRA